MWELQYYLIFYITVFIVCIIIALAVRLTKRKQVRDLSNNAIELSPDEFFRLRKATLKGKGKYNTIIAEDYMGVYILFNKTKNMYYVGQAKKVMQRVNAHFTGHGNGDVYADYKYGDDFTIKTISLTSSGYSSLDKLERDTIMAYEAFSRGYNKTRGNK